MLAQHQVCSRTVEFRRETKSLHVRQEKLFFFFFYIFFLDVRSWMLTFKEESVTFYKRKPETTCTSIFFNFYFSSFHKRNTTLFLFSSFPSTVRLSKVELNKRSCKEIKKRKRQQPSYTVIISGNISY